MTLRPSPSKRPKSGGQFSTMTIAPNRRVRRHSRRTESAVFLIGNLVAAISMALMPLGIEII